MKKLLLMAAVAGFALASCTSEDETYEAQNNQEAEISFAAPVMYKATRVLDENNHGEIEGIKYPETLSFNVWGIKYPGNYPGWDATAAEEAFTQNGGVGKSISLTVNPKKFNNKVIGWFPAKKETFEGEKKYTFAAFSPSTVASTSYNKNGLAITAYEIPALGLQDDIMYSARHYNIDKNSSVTSNANGNEDYNGINLVFKHALSAVHFKTCVDPDYLKAMEAAGYDASKIEFRIKKITLQGVYTQGNFAENIDLTLDTKAQYASAAKWTVAGDKNTAAGYVFFECGADETYGSLVPKPADLKTATLENSLKDISDKGVFDKATSAFSGILLPQIFGGTTGSENNDAKIIIEWSMNDGKQENCVDQENVEIILNKWTDEWLPAKRYNYNIIFKENLIYFAPQVEDWTNENITINPN